MTPRPLNVLLVEDSADDADLMLLELRRAGYAPSAERVETPATFRAALAARAWDVILCDNSMPALNAQGSLDLLSASGRDVPLVVVSGTIGEERAVELMRAGATDFVMKGSLGRLAPAVEREVRHAAERQERRRAEQDALRLAALVESSDDAIISKTLDGAVTSWNPAAERLYGWSSREAVGRHISFLVPPDLADELAGIMVRLRGGDRVEHFETVRLVRDGTRIDVCLTISPIRDAEGRVVGASKIARDISARKRTEADRALLAAVVESSDEAIVVADPEGVILGWNPAAERLFGYSPEEAAGRSNFLLLVPPDLLGESRERVERVRRGERLAPHETVRLRKGGEPVHVAVTVSAVRVVGRVVALAAVYRDTTARREAEAARARAEDAVRASEERYRTVVEDQTEVVCRVRADGTFLFVNDVLCRLVGKTRDELLGRPGTAVPHPRDVSLVTAALATLSPDNSVVRVEHRILDADGQTRWMEFVNRGVFGPDGGLVEFQAVGRDVTARRQADESIRESEARYRGLADAMPQIVWVTRPDGYHEFYNRQWYDYTELGYDDTKGEGWNHVFHPDDQPVAWDRWRHALATGDPYEVEYRCRRHDGEYRWFLGRALPQRDETGKIVRWFGTCTDIHDFKQAEAERADLLARLNLQIERMPLAYLLTDTDFRYTGWNPAAERTFGFSRAEVLGKLPFEVVVPPQSRAAIADLFARLAAGDMDANGACENVTRDGRVITCEWYNTPLYGLDGTFQGVLSLAQDVTARRKADETLHLRDRAIQAVTGGLLITDATRPDHPIVFASPGFERLTGYTAAEVVGRNCRLLQGPGTDPQAVAAVREAVRDARACEVELLNYRKDGTPFWNELHVSPVRDAEGQLTHFVGVQNDVTGRRKLEDQFRQAQKMDAVGRLAAGVAHDFNNLLTVINGYGEIVHDALPPGDPNQLLMGQITRAGERAAGLTRQLLAFSRQTVLEAKVLDPNALVRDLEGMLVRLIGEDIDMATRLGQDAGRVKADPGQLEQAVVNLCVNARDAMPTGGKLTVETRNVELDAAYAAIHPDVRPGRYVMLAVSDTGTGMTPEVRDRIFDPFFTTKGVGKGTGLGLAMVFGFVKQSGGHIGVHSEPGRGATFKLYLPRVAGAAAPSGSAAGRVALPRGMETVLLVEDEEGVRSLTRHVLQTCGYAVLEARHGREAVRTAEQHPGPIHLLLTDVVMPHGMGGPQVADAVRSLHPETLVLYVSGYTDDAVVRHGVLDEGTNFLQKPFTPASLAAKVRDVLDRTSRGGGA